MATPYEATDHLADAALQSDIHDELSYDPEVPAANIAVAVTDHTVTLAGTVHSLPERLAAVKAAQRVKGVHAIIDEIAVVPSYSKTVTDQDIALAIERILESSSTIPPGVRATVRHGHVTVTGDVDHQFQKNAAVQAIEAVKGVTWIDNQITVTVEASDKDIRSKIVAALHRHADLDARDIHVVSNGTDVWLSGTTSSLTARADAEAAAWSAPGVERVYNNLRVK